MAGNNVLTATDANFETEVLKSNLPALVDFWAEWCGPCKMIGPTVDELSTQFAGKVKVFKMNVDENPETPAKYRIRGIPTLLLFKGGEVFEQLVGAQPKASIEKMMQRSI